MIIGKFPSWVLFLWLASGLPPFSCLCLGQSEEFLLQLNEEEPNEPPLPPALPLLFQPIVYDDVSAADNETDQAPVPAHVSQAVIIRLQKLRVAYEVWKRSFRDWWKKHPAEAHGFAIGLGSTLTWVHTQDAQPSGTLIGESIENILDQSGPEGYWSEIYQVLDNHVDDRRMLVSLFQISGIMSADVEHSVNNAFMAALIMTGWGALDPYNANSYEAWSNGQDSNGDEGAWLTDYFTHMLHLIIWLSDRHEEGASFSPRSGSI